MASSSEMDTGLRQAKRVEITDLSPLIKPEPIWLQAIVTSFRLTVIS
jgi:hypothetical protein